MHMADTLVSPVVGGALWTFAVSVGGYSIRKIRKISDGNARIIPLIGVAAAFVFAAQMINFTIPGTGSSGHIGGGVFLSILLGPYAAFLAMMVILIIQALCFADGGILALGANMINMGFFACFIAYPFIYKPLVNKNKTRSAVFGGAIAASVIGMQMGAFCVVLETLLSGKTVLPFTTFVLLMQPIHFAIGLAEGLITAVLVHYLHRHAPELVVQNPHQIPGGEQKRSFQILAFFTLLCAGVLSLFASGYPDGLEWSIGKTTERDLFETTMGSAQQLFQSVQNLFAFLPDYGFRNAVEAGSSGRMGTSVSGLVGSALTMLVMCAIVLGITFFKRKRSLN